MKQDQNQSATNKDMDGGGGEDDDANKTDSSKSQDVTENPSNSNQLDKDVKGGDINNLDNSKALNPSQSQQHTNVGDASDNVNPVTTATQNPSLQRRDAGEGNGNISRSDHPLTQTPSQSHQYEDTAKTDNTRIQDVAEIPTQSHLTLSQTSPTPARDVLKALIKVKIGEKLQLPATSSKTTAGSDTDQSQLFQGVSNAGDDGCEAQEFQGEESMEWRYEDDGGSKSCEDSLSPGQDIRILKKEKHRFAARRYRHKEMWMKEKLLKVSKKKKTEVYYPMQ